MKAGPGLFVDDRLGQLRWVVATGQVILDGWQRQDLPPTPILQVRLVGGSNIIDCPPPNCHYHPYHWGSMDGTSDTVVATRFCQSRKALTLSRKILLTSLRCLHWLIFMFFCLVFFHQNIFQLYLLINCTSLLVVLYFSKVKSACVVLTAPFAQRKAG